MYSKCPKCGHERAADAEISTDICPACGLVFSKYLKSRFGVPAAPGARANAPADEERTGIVAGTKALLLHVPEEVGVLAVYARAGLLAALVVYGWKLAAMDIASWEIGSSLMHLPLLPIHEFGHILFRPFGEFMHLIGGSLLQVALPLAFGGIFLVKNRDPFSAAVMLWWSAVSVLDVAPYAYDAQAPQHVLLTGRTGDTGSHDFIDVLGMLGLLTRAQSVGYAIHRFGVVMLIVSIIWAGWIVWRQMQVRKAQGA